MNPRRSGKRCCDRESTGKGLVLGVRRPLTSIDYPCFLRLASSMQR